MRFGSARVHHYRRLLGLLAVGCGFLSACAGDGSFGNGSSNPPPSGDFATVQREVFDITCTTASCHAAQSRAGGLSLASGESYDQLVNIDPQNNAALGAGWKRVTPSLPDESYLLRKLSGNLGPGEGSSMPLGATPLATSEPDKFEMIRQWVAAGAPRDSTPTPTPTP